MGHPTAYFIAFERLEPSRYKNGIRNPRMGRGISTYISLAFTNSSSIPQSQISIIEDCASRTEIGRRQGAPITVTKVGRRRDREREPNFCDTLAESPNMNYDQTTLLLSPSTMKLPGGKDSSLAGMFVPLYYCLSVCLWHRYYSFPLQH